MPRRSSIPPDLPPERVIFSANRFVSNGKVPEITHIVYVDLEGYSQLSDKDECATSAARSAA